MMEMVNPDVETPFLFRENEVLLLIEENPKEFYQKVMELIRLFNGEESSFSLWEEGKCLKAESVGEIIQNCFSFSLNSKKMQTLFYKKCDEIYQRDNGILKLNEINTKISNFLGDILFEFPFSVEYDEIEFLSLLKTVSLRFSEEYSSLLEKLLVYVNVLIELKRIRLLVFVNLKTVLSDEELGELYHHCFLQKVNVLLVESGKIRPLLKEERAVLITEDLCEILEKGEKL